MLNQLWVLGRKMKSDGTLWNIKVYNITLTKVAQRIDYKISITPLPRESSRGLLIVCFTCIQLNDLWWLNLYSGKKITLNVKLFIFFIFLNINKNTEDFLIFLKIRHYFTVSRMQFSSTSFALHAIYFTLRFLWQTKCILLYIRCNWHRLLCFFPRDRITCIFPYARQMYSLSVCKKLKRKPFIKEIF